MVIRSLNLSTVDAVLTAIPPPAIPCKPGIVPRAAKPAFVTYQSTPIAKTGAKFKVKLEVKPATPPLVLPYNAFASAYSSPISAPYILFKNDKPNPGIPEAALPKSSYQDLLELYVSSLLAKGENPNL